MGAWITPASAESRIRLSNSITRFLSTTRRRERIMKRFKSPRHVQRFLSTHDQLANLFLRRRDRGTAANLRSGRTQAFATPADVTGVAMAA
jgi:putative transposase